MTVQLQKQVRQPEPFAEELEVGKKGIRQHAFIQELSLRPVGWVAL